MKRELLVLWTLFCLSAANPAPEANSLLEHAGLKKSRRYLQEKEETFLSNDENRRAGIGRQDDLRETDKISRMPGQVEKVEFDQYAGYVTVDAKAGTALFYYFVEAPLEPSKKPLVLWLNGGPGCSSFGSGAMLELGPFSVCSDNKTLYKKKYAWNTVANMLFLEATAGVGYSYSNTTSDYYETGDKRTKEDTYTFLVNWLERFPESRDHEFFITAESYAGHYIPELANLTASNNKASKKSNIKLKGVAIGNADLDGDVNLKAEIDYYWAHAMISERSCWKYALEAKM